MYDLDKAKEQDGSFISDLSGSEPGFESRGTGNLEEQQSNLEEDIFSEDEPAT
jgi:hypothetical protein